MITQFRSRDVSGTTKVGTVTFAERSRLPLSAPVSSTWEGDIGPLHSPREIWYISTPMYTVKLIMQCRSSFVGKIGFEYSATQVFEYSNNIRFRVGRNRLFKK